MKAPKKFHQMLDALWSKMEERQALDLGMNAVIFDREDPTIPDRIVQMRLTVALHPEDLPLKVSGLGPEWVPFG